MRLGLAAAGLSAALLAPGEVLGGPARVAGGSEVLSSGPLPVRDRFVLGLGFLVPEPESADLLARGRWRLGAVASISNSWSHSDRIRVTLRAREERGELGLEELRGSVPFRPTKGLYHVDGEVRSLSLSARRRLNERWEASVSLPLVSMGGGSSDSGVESFHDLVAAGQAVRGGKIRDDFTVYLRLPDGSELYRSEGSGPEIGDLSLSVKRRLGVPGPRRFRQAVSAVVELPTGSEATLAGSGSVDLGLRFLLEAWLHRSVLRGSLGVLRVGSADHLGLPEQTLLAGDLGYELAFGARTSISVRLSAAQSRFKDARIERLEDEIFLLDLGAKRQLRHGRTLFVAITENLNRGGSSDFALHFGALKDL